MKKILLTIGLLLTFTFVNGQLAGIISSEDKSGPSYGPELLTDGEFAVGTDWTFNTGWTYDGENDEADYDDATDGATLVQASGDLQVIFKINTTYKFELDVSGNQIQFQVLSSNGGEQYRGNSNYAVGSHEVEFTTGASVGTNGIMIKAKTASVGACSITNLSIKEVL